MDYSPRDSSVHVISQARILEWVAISFSRGSFPLRNWTPASCIGRKILYHWATRGAVDQIFCTGSRMATYLLRAEQGNKTREPATKERPYWDHHESEITKVSNKKHKTRVQSIVGGLCEHSQARNMQNLKIKIFWSLPTKTRYFANKGLSSQGYGFSSSHVWMWELDCEESWAPKNWCFWTVVLEKILESLLDPRRCNQSILKEISPECSLEGLMLKLKLQYFGHLMWRFDSLEKTLLLGRIGGRRDDWGWDGWMASPTRWTWVWVNSGSWWWTGRPGVLQFMGSQRVRHNWATELNWKIKVSKNKTGSWLWLRSWTPYCQIQT